jgi:hypothetical protein
MKIITPGRLPSGDDIYECECPHCRCVFQTKLFRDNGEPENVTRGPDGAYWIVCPTPTCDVRVRMIVRIEPCVWAPGDLVRDAVDGRPGKVESISANGQEILVEMDDGRFRWRRTDDLTKVLSRAGTETV